MLATRNRIVAWPIVSSDFWRDMNALNGRGDVQAEVTWRPAAMVAETPDHFTLRLEAPGVSTESLHVELDGEYLTISGHREGVPEDGNRKVLLSEIAWGPFQRRFRLGSEVDRDGITAEYRDGLLEVSVPKRQEARPRRIPVSTEAR